MSADNDVVIIKLGLWKEGGKMNCCAEWKGLFPLDVVPLHRLLCATGTNQSIGALTLLFLFID